MSGKLDALRARLSTYVDISHSMAVLSWDQHTYMPKGGAPARAGQLSTLSRIAHELFTSPETGDLLAAAEDESAGLAYDSDGASLLRLVRHLYDRQTKLPNQFVADFARLRSQANQVWEKAREEDDFASFRPYLERIVAMSLESAEYLGYDEQPYDALLDAYEPHMKTSEVARIFDSLREELVPLVQAVFDQGEQVDDKVLRQHFDVEKQRAFGKAVIGDLGYDFDRGRQDESAHPFTTGFSVDDVRITTRYNPSWLPVGLFGTLHEAGHALYNQGLAPELEGTLLAGGASLGVHESQSRLWENIVGRSRPFWEHYYPKLRRLFPAQLEATDVESFYKAVNRVVPSLIRVEADELTYNLHVMMRFELEKALLSGDLKVAELPTAWGDVMDQVLGVRPDSDTEGVLQDVHWSNGMVGYFPTYTLGNLLSAQLYGAAVAQSPEIVDQVKRGEFRTLLGWMRQHVHRHGRKYFPTELIERASGEKLQSRSYMEYLRTKYRGLYDL